jgi:nitrite reductase/ring-hydroxylating ferredoxin subunit
MAGDEVSRWSGQIMEPIDSLGFCGLSPGDKDNVYIITGDSGDGMTHATLSAIILTDLIMGRSNAWAPLYDPSRKRGKRVFSYLSHLADVNLQYKGWVSPGEVSDIEDIRPGCGAVLRCGLKRVAVYKDTDGKCHSYSAACPHLGGVVKWNNFEKSWDCPVHGSRFDRYGRAVTGPTTKDLAESPMPASRHTESKKKTTEAATTSTGTTTTDKDIPEVVPETTTPKKNKKWKKKSKKQAVDDKGKDIPEKLSKDTTTPTTDTTSINEDLQPQVHDDLRTAKVGK